ncbi:MAG: hypothetical protein OXG24_11755 [Gammaproteobacteria bacterium]|nr:hypothetical protein [Gammaproteobacteria bacterium]
MPEHLALDCYLDLVGDPEAYGSERDEGTHWGLDLAVPTGTDVSAAKYGEVSKVVRGYLVGDRSTYNGTMYESNITMTY